MCRGNLAREAYVYQGTYKGGIFEEGRISDILFQYILPNVCCATSDKYSTSQIRKFISKGTLLYDHVWRSIADIEK